MSTQVIRVGDKCPATEPSCRASPFQYCWRHGYKKCSHLAQSHRMEIDMEFFIYAHARCPNDTSGCFHTTSGEANLCISSIVGGSSVSKKRLWSGHPSPLKFLLLRCVWSLMGAAALGECRPSFRSISIVHVYHTEDSVLPAQIFWTWITGDKLVLGRREGFLLASRIRTYR